MDWPHSSSSSPVSPTSTYLPRPARRASEGVGGRAVLQTMITMMMTSRWLGDAAAEGRQRGGATGAGGRTVLQTMMIMVTRTTRRRRRSGAGVGGRTVLQAPPHRRRPQRRSGGPTSPENRLYWSTACNAFDQCGEAFDQYASIQRID